MMRLTAPKKTQEINNLTPVKLKTKTYIHRHIDACTQTRTHIETPPPLPITAIKYQNQQSLVI